MAETEDIPALAGADKVVVQMLSYVGGERFTISDPKALQEIRNALVLEEVPPSGTFSWATLTWLVDDHAVRQAWIMAHGEWGFQRPSTGYSLGYSPDLVAILKEQYRLVYDTGIDRPNVSVEETNRYSSEVEGYRFYSSATWKTLIPLKSTIADVCRVLGPPTYCEDIANSDSQYPGHQEAVQPVLTYELNDEWDILVHFVKSSVPHRKVFDKSLYDTLYSIDYVPREPMRFDLTQMPPRFVRRHISR